MKNKYFFLFLLPLFALASCGKYEDGPGFSLRTKKARLTGTWNIEKVEGQSLDSGESIEWTFEKDGTFKFVYKENGDVDTANGTWDFSSDKEDLRLTVFGFTVTFEILRLTNKDLWMTDEDNLEWRLSKI
jgi:hypothetical protein